MQAWNRYAYANNNPVNLTDPTGHFACGDGIDDPRCDQFDSPIVVWSSNFPNDPLLNPEYSTWRALVAGSPCTGCHVTHDGYMDDGRIPDNSQLDPGLVAYYRSLDPFAKTIHLVALQSVLNMYALAPIDEMDLATNASSVKGKFPLSSGDEYLNRASPGSPGFGRYDPVTGNIVYRVDLGGPADAGVLTPHLHYPQYNVIPSTGELRFNDWFTPVPYYNPNFALNPVVQLLLTILGLQK